MMPDMHADAEQFGRIWDALQAGQAPAGEEDAAYVQAIRDLESVLHVPAPPPELISQTWSRIAGTSLMLAPYPGSSLARAATNGHIPNGAVTAPAILTRSDRMATVVALYRLLAIGVAAGMGAGFVVGIWTRVAMRLAGFLTVDAYRRILTENDARVGEITLGGTLSLASFSAVLGVLGGILYIVLRRWLPGRSWRRSLGYGALLLAVFGFIIMDPGNPDYRLFGPAWLNIVTFSLAYVLFGLLAGTLAEWLDRKAPPLGAVTRSRRRTAALLVAGAPLVLIGSVGVAALGIGLIAFAPWVLAVLAGATIATLTIPRLKRTRAIAIPPPGRRFWYATCAIPGLAGLVVTVRNIIEIMQG